MRPDLVIPTVAILAVFSVPIVALIVAYHVRRLQSQERVKAIEKGVPIPFEPADPMERAARTRRWGIVLVALGLGLIVMMVVVATVERDRDALIGVGAAAIPILVGLGLLIDYRLRVKEIEAAAARQNGRTSAG